MLYFCDGNFGCRHCHELTYYSKNENRRHKWFRMGRVLEIGDETDKLMGELKRWHYRGKPTRKQRRIERLIGKSGLNYRRSEQFQEQDIDPELRRIMAGLDRNKRG